MFIFFVRSRNCKNCNEFYYWILLIYIFLCIFDIWGFFSFINFFCKRGIFSKILMYYYKYFFWVNSRLFFRGWTNIERCKEFSQVQKWDREMTRLLLLYDSFFFSHCSMQPHTYFLSTSIFRNQQTRKTPWEFHFSVFASFLFSFYFYFIFFFFLLFTLLLTFRAKSFICFWNKSSLLLPWFITDISHFRLFNYFLLSFSYTNIYSSIKFFT